jgi:hypothetical protein
VNLRDELLAIRDAAGVLTPGVVVDAARPADHPLHDRFEWDDALAGEAWRRFQARDLIQSVRAEYVRPNGTTGRIRAFHSIPGEDPSRPVFEPLEDIVENPVTRAVLVAQMRREWTAFKERYEHLVEFAELFGANAAA